MATSIPSTLTAEDVAALRRLVEEEWTAALASFQKDPSGKWLVKAVCFNWDRPMPNAP